METSAVEVDIVIPVWNEEESFPHMYAAAEKIRARWNLYIVYDSPEDTTLRTAQAVADRDPRVRLVQNKSHGVISAITTGLEQVQAPAVLITAIDLPQDVVLVDDLLARMRSSGAAIVAPSRYIKGGGRNSGNWLNSTLSRLANTTLPLVAGIPIHDATNGSKLYDKSFLRRVHIETVAGWALALELTVKAHMLGLPMVEVPVFHAPRAAGVSKFRLGAWLPEYVRWYACAVAHRFFPHRTPRV